MNLEDRPKKITQTNLAKSAAPKEMARQPKRAGNIYTFP
jgi:hypothetical protein